MLAYLDFYITIDCSKHTLASRSSSPCNNACCEKCSIIVQCASHVFDMSFCAWAMYGIGGTNFSCLKSARVLVSHSKLWPRNYGIGIRCQVGGYHASLHFCLCAMFTNRWFQMQDSSVLGFIRVGCDNNVQMDCESIGIDIGVELGCENRIWSRYSVLLVVDKQQLVVHGLLPYRWQSIVSLSLWYPVLRLDYRYLYGR